MEAYTYLDIPRDPPYESELLKRLIDYANRKIAESEMEACDE